jgi:20S proteasome alpha/beta subunit
MTIIVGITTPDGVILASDSRLTRETGDGYRTMSDSSQKVFEVGGYGVAMAGLAFIADHTIAGLMDQFVAQVSDDDRKTVDTFADALGAFFDRRFAAWFEGAGETYDVEKSGYQILFFVAGYNDAGVGHIRQVLIPGADRGDESPDTTDPETIRGGRTEVIDRLLHGKTQYPTRYTNACNRSRIMS